MLLSTRTGYQSRGSFQIDRSTWNWSKEFHGSCEIETRHAIGPWIPIYTEQNRGEWKTLSLSGSSTWVWCVPWLDECEAHDCGCGVLWSRLSPAGAGGFITGFSSFTGVGGASFRGGILSFIASRPFASANEVILWLGEKPCRAANNGSE